MWRGDLKKKTFILLISQNLAKHAPGWSPLEPQHKIEKETTLLTRRRQASASGSSLGTNLVMKIERFLFLAKTGRSNCYHSLRTSTETQVTQRLQRKLEQGVLVQEAVVAAAAWWVLRLLLGLLWASAFRFSLTVFASSLSCVVSFGSSSPPVSLSFFPFFFLSPICPNRAEYIYVYIDTVVSASFFRKKSMSCQLRLLGFLTVFVS